jgi:hypothetical protein
MSSSVASQPSATEHAAGMADYIREGERLAEEVGNHGPLRLDDEGKLHQDILDAYWQHGFYVFEGVIDKGELDELRAGVDELLERAPVSHDSMVDARGRPALGPGFKRFPYLFIKPLSDPWGGTKMLNGRHPTQMIQPVPDAAAPDEVVYIISGWCQMMEAGLRLYGHPHLLAVAEAINGEDFVPYNDVIFVKQAGLGGAVSWHQDGVTHWDADNWDEGIHGFNFQIQLYPTNSGNCLWVVPGTHKQGRIDIKALLGAENGSEQFPGALPLNCEAGDVTIVNRQVVHGSFANTSPDPRISLTCGFHRRSSILGAHGALSQTHDEVYDEQRIFERSRVIAVAIDARAQHFTDEGRFVYQPFKGLEDDYRWSEATFDNIIRDYNLQDLSI